MANVSKNTRQRYRLAGQEINASEEWMDVIIRGEYENDSVQPNITIDDFTFNLEARTAIKNWIASGRIFEGMPIEITLFNNQPQTETFVSLLNFVEGYQDFPDDGKLNVAVTKERGVNRFFDQIQTISYAFLYDQGIITNGDFQEIDYFVERKIDPVQIIITNVVIYLLVKELEESIRRTGAQIATTAGYISGSITGSIGAAVYQGLIAIVEIIYTAALLAAIIQLGKDLFDSLLPIRRTHKVLPLRTMLTKVCQYYGFNFQTDIDILDKLYYLPSNPNVDTPNFAGIIEFPRGTQSGIPRPADRGYIVSELFALVREMFDAKYAIIDGTVQCRPRDSDFWRLTAQYELPDVLINTKEYNTQELPGTNLLSFQTDLTDEYTLDRYAGTAIEIKTDPISISNNENNLITGLNEIQFGVALGNRKNDLAAIEKALRGAGRVIDEITGVFGRGTNFVGRIENRVGGLLVSNNNHNLSKILYLQGGKIPGNARDVFSAPALWRNYYGDQSFVRNNFRGQKAIYRQVEIPFGLEDYKILSTNSYFKFRGQEAKIISFEWNMERDTATIDFWVREVYTTNLRETEIIPD